uniref:hypothetical protein n=1 Tax=Gemmiger formicilis TaxID=745368 RepID=UPI0040259584
HGICVAKMLDNTQSIICAFGLAAAAPRSPYRYLELCGIAFTIRPARQKDKGNITQKSVKNIRPAPCGAGRTA